MSKKIKQDISIGDNLRKLRTKAGLSQEQAAAQLQIQGLPISREILSQMENGKYSIRVSILMELTKIYNAPVEEFFRDLT